MLNPSQREVCTVSVGHPVHFTLKAEFLEVHIKYLCTPFQLCKCCHPLPGDGNKLEPEMD